MPKDSDDGTNLRKLSWLGIELVRFIKFERYGFWYAREGLNYLDFSLNTNYPIPCPTIEMISSRPDRKAVYYGLLTDYFNHLEDTAASSATKCAMDCSRTPACRSFKFDMGQCSLGG